MNALTTKNYTCFVYTILGKQAELIFNVHVLMTDDFGVYFQAWKSFFRLQDTNQVIVLVAGN